MFSFGMCSWIICRNIFPVCLVQMRQHEAVVRLKLEPFAIHLHHTLDQLQAADTANIFGRPVTLQEVVRHPTMSSVPVCLFYKGNVAMTNTNVLFTPLTPKIGCEGVVFSACLSVCSSRQILLPDVS